jgi:DNA-binding response OmpR family regulator
MAYLDAQDGLAVIPDGEINLTIREVQIMLVLVENQPHWVSTDHLTTIVQISPENLSMRIRTLRQKLPSLIRPQSRWGYGYRVEGWEHR